MSDHATTADHEHGKHSHIKLYLITGLVLTIVTVVELIIPFIDAIPRSVVVPALIGLSAFKFAGVVAIFMHLKDDHKLYQFLFLPPMGIAVIMVVVLMLMAVRHYSPYLGFPELRVNTERLELPEEQQLATLYAGAVQDEEFGDAPELYATTCAPCHRADGGGQTGPAFTDDCWIHGAELRDHMRVLYKGVPGTAMVSFRGQLTDEQIQNMALYVHSFTTKEAENPKPCEGQQVKNN